MSKYSVAFLAIAFVVLRWCSGAAAEGALPEHVTFMSLDNQTTLVGYVFAPRGKATRMPAIVMMHGRAGAYSSEANGRYDASTLSKRHRMWGDLWVDQGYVAILVDGFGPRGYPQGFPRFSYDQRPESLNEVTVRPLDAYGGLAYLRTRRDVIADHVGLQGWSNGGSATLASMAVVAADTPGAAMRGPTNGFRAGTRILPGLRFEGDVRGRLSPLRAGTRPARRCRRGSVAQTLCILGRKEPCQGGRHRDHALPRRHARFRRSGAYAAKCRRQCRRQGGRIHAGANILLTASRRPSRKIMAVEA